MSPDVSGALRIMTVILEMVVGSGKHKVSLPRSDPSVTGDSCHAPEGTECAP